MSDVTIYTSPFCPYCHRAKDLLQRKGAEIHEIDILLDSDARCEMEKKSGRSTVPQIFVGAKHIGGCDDLYALESAGKLDSVLAA